MSIFYPTPRICDICSEELNQVMYDAKTLDGPWACLCPSCWATHTKQELGIGLGQKYLRNAAGQFESKK